MSLTHAETIAALAAQGIKAAVCPYCGHVREVVDDRLIGHGSPACEGGGHFFAPPADPTFDAVVSDLADEIEDETSTDWATQCQRGVTDHLKACFVAMECEDAEQCSRHTGTCPPSPAHAPFDGCADCITREVMILTWDYAREAEAEDVVAFLLKRSEHPSYGKHRTAVQALAKHVAEGGHRECEHDHDEDS